MTEINSVTTRLLSAIEDRLTHAAAVEVYLFGSATQRRSYADVDVLLVYPNGDLSSAHDLAEAIRALPADAIYDVLALSKSEERELKFINGERAIRIWPPTH